MNGGRDYYPASSEEEWIDLERLREIIAEIESLGGSAITPVDLLNRLGIEDAELELLKFSRTVAASSGNPPALPGAAEVHASGRRKAKTS